LAEAPAPEAARAAAEDRSPCPACQQLSARDGRCTACGLVLSQACPRCQNPSPAEGGGRCARCGCPLTGRDALAAREFEQGLRRLGIVPPSGEATRRFPQLQSEGRVYAAWIAPWLPWQPTSELHLPERSVKGSFFVTDRALVFANGTQNRRIGYGQIRRLLVTGAERSGSVARPRLRIGLDAEELTVSVPVVTDRPTEFVSLVQSFVANRRFSLAEKAVAKTEASSGLRVEG